MANRDPRLRLGAFFHPTGNHVASWLDEGAQLDAGTNFEHYVSLAQTAERGKFDLLFLADSCATRSGDLHALKRWPQYMTFFDPLTLLAGIAARTSRIGLVATATTSYNEPYTLARRLASLDHMSGGRLGWNVVTSSNPAEALNYGRDEHFEHGIRYDRADDFVAVVRGLLDSWDDDAFLRDRASATYFDPTKLHVLDHDGAHFKVRGPLNMARPPQGFPVVAQATASGRGMDTAGAIAEILFTPLHSIEQALAFSAELRASVRARGRDDTAVKVMPGLNPIVAASEAEARRRHDHLAALIHGDVGRAALSTAFGGMDLSGVDDDKPLPDDVRDEALRRGGSEARTVVAMASHGDLTFRQLYQKYAGGRGQRTLIGTPETIADDMQSWFEAGAVDGFLIQPSVLPADLDTFVDTVVPVLQRRGLFRREYEGETLRENLGLARPESRYARSSE